MQSIFFSDVHYYVESPGFGYSNRNHLVAMQHMRTPSDPTQQQMNTGQIFFSYEQIVEITNEFSSENVIGEGGFGRVYKASMPDGRVGAVKLLKVGSGQGEREFRAEVDIISRVHHRHLVSLIGYCLSEQQRALIYEFVPNGNLDQHVHGNVSFSFALLFSLKFFDSDPLQMFYGAAVAETVNSLNLTISTDASL